MSKKEKTEGKGSGVVASIVIIAVVVLIILGISLFSNKNAGQKNENESGESSAQDESSGESAAEIPKLTEHIINITIQGFVPKTLEIKKGDKVTWISQIATASWVAGDVHPTHTNYPGSSIIKCGTAEEKNIFDSCKSFLKGESYSFVFNEVGSWSYHNHLNPSKDAKIIVEE